MVEYVYIHKDSYLGGEYETAGGYDIVCLKMFAGQHLEGYQNVYLPAPNFRLAELVYKSLSE